MNKIHKIALLSVSLLFMSSGTEAEKYKKPPGSPHAYEVRFLTVELHANGLGTVVARPCDSPVGCELLYARIDPMTKLFKNKKQLTPREARKLKWHSGVIAINSYGTAVFIKLFGGKR